MIYFFLDLWDKFLGLLDDVFIRHFYGNKEIRLSGILFLMSIVGIFFSIQVGLYLALIAIFFRLGDL